jgi:hypothetical protein
LTVASNLRPLDVQQFVTRLQTHTGDAFVLIDRAVNSATAIDAGTAPSPSAFVLEPNYRAVGAPVNAGGGLISQNTAWQIPVLTMIRHYGDPLGKKASVQCETAREQLWAAMVGFMPNPNWHAVQLDSGRMVAHKNQCFYFMDVFSMTVRISNEET